MTAYSCNSCGFPYPSKGLPHQCPHCGGVFGLRSLNFPTSQTTKESPPSIWRYQSSFGLPPDASPIYLGEGNTPLVERVVRGKRVAFKLESLNPTGSFKDRGTAVLASFLKSRGISEVVEDSSGNAGASLAAYTSALGIQSHIFVPESASGPKLQQMLISGAHVVRIPGAREKAHQAALDYVKEKGLPYASHALLPMGISGIATIAYELAEQLGTLPGTVIVPVGHGSMMIGLQLGLQALCAENPGCTLPIMVGVQPANCAPLAARWEHKAFEGIKGKSMAEGTQIENPVHESEILAMLRPGQDQILAVDEGEIRAALYELAGMGFYVEPTSAMVWAALTKNQQKLPEPIVLIISGFGLKFIQTKL